MSQKNNKPQAMPASAVITHTKTIDTPDAENSVWGKVFIASLVAVFILMTIMSFSYGISGDEIDMNEYGKAVLKFFTSFGSDKMVLDMPKEFNRDGVMQYYGGLFDMICALVNKVSPLNEYTTRHILNAWAGFVAIFFAAKICVRVFNKNAATFCVWLMFLSPFFLGHAMNNPKDVPFAAATIASLYCIIRFFDHMPKPPVRWYVWTILSIAAAINVRVGGILLIPYMVAFAVIIYIVKRFFQDEQPAPKTWIKPLVIVAVLGYLGGSLFWPFALENPITNPLTALSEMSSFPVGIAQIFEGTRYSSAEPASPEALPKLPTDFLPKSFMITNSYVLLIGLVLIVLFIWGIRKNKNASIIYFIFFTALFPMAYIIHSGANVYHAWRHVLFIFPSMAVAATGGWYFFSNYLSKRNFKYGMVIAAVLLLEPAYFIAATFPNTITYHNAFAGGIKGAYGNYEMDYYYNSLKQDADWFKKNELPKYKPTDTVILASNAAHIMIQYFKDNKNVKVLYVRFPERDQKKWDYSVFHIALIPEEEMRAGTWLPVTTLFKSTVKGYPLSVVAKRPSYDDLKGFDALQKQQVDSALNYFNSYMKADPNNVDMMNILANIYHQLHRDDIAQQYKAQMDKLLSAGTGNDY